VIVIVNTLTAHSLK